MSLSSLEFVIFTAVCVTGYYRIPKKLQWIWLLVFSYVYYMAAGPALVVFLLLTTATNYYGALLAQNGSRPVSKEILNERIASGVSNFSPFFRMLQCAAEADALSAGLQTRGQI